MRAALLVALAGCGCAAPAIDLTIRAGADVAPAALRSIARLDFAISGAQQKLVSTRLATPMSSMRGEQVLIRPSVSAGTLVIVVSARDEAGGLVAQGRSSIALAPRALAVELVLASSAPASPPPVGDAGAPADAAPPPDAAPVGDAAAPAVVTVLAGHNGGAGTADGVGASARLDAPTAVASDGNGHVYVLDSASYILRVVDVASGAVRTIAGSAGSPGQLDGVGAAAQLGAAGAMTWLDGALYFTDPLYCLVRKLDVAGGTVSTIAGAAGQCSTVDGNNASARFAAPFGIAASGGALYITDVNDHVVRRLLLADGSVTTIAGSAGVSGSADGVAASARFATPHGIAADGSGNLYVADFGNDTVRLVAGGSVTTVAGSAGAGGSLDGVGVAARLVHPEGIVCDGKGSVYVSDSGAAVVRQLAVATRRLTTLAGTPTKTGSADGTGADASFYIPNGLAWDGARLFVADFGNHTLRAITTDGRVTTLAGAAPMNGSVDGPAESARFSAPAGLARWGNDIYIADQHNHTIRRYRLDTGMVSTLAGTVGSAGSFDAVGTNASFNLPAGLAADGLGQLFVADSGNHVIRRIDLHDSSVATLAGSAGHSGFTDGVAEKALFDDPVAVAADVDGSIYVADRGNHCIRRVWAGNVTTIAGNGTSGTADGTGAAAQLDGPGALALDGRGGLYVADTWSHTLRRVVTASGAVSTVAGTALQSGSSDGVGAAARFSFPRAIAYDGARVYIADGADTLRVFDVATAAVRTLAGTPGQGALLPGRLPALVNQPAALTILAPHQLLLVDANENVLAGMTYP